MKKSGFKVSYHPLVVDVDIPKLDRSVAGRIKKAIESKLFTNPEIYGLPLRGTLKKYWKLRVGDWRIVYEIVKKEIRILIISHRKDVYKMAEGRK